MTSSGRRKTHGLATEKSTGRGTAPSVAKNMGYRRKKHHQRRKHTLPMQKTWPAVAKNMPSHQDRRKKHPPPLQKTPPTGTVAKNTKTSQRRKKHELPTQKTRNPKRWVYSPYQLVSRISSINSIYMIYTYMIYTYILYTYIHIYIYPHRCWAPSNNLRTSKGLWSSYFRSDSRLSGPWRICIIFDRCTIVWCALMCMLQFKRVCFLSVFLFAFPMMVILCIERTSIPIGAATILHPGNR